MPMPRTNLPDPPPDSTIISNWHAALKYHPTLSHDILLCHDAVQQEHQRTDELLDHIEGLWDTLPDASPFCERPFWALRDPYHVDEAELNALLHGMPTDAVRDIRATIGAYRHQHGRASLTVNATSEWLLQRYERLWTWTKTPRLRLWEFQHVLQMAVSEGAWGSRHVQRELLFHSGAYDHAAPLAMSAFTCPNWVPSGLPDEEPLFGKRIYSNLPSRNGNVLGMERHVALVIRVPIGATWEDIDESVSWLKEHNESLFPTRHPGQRGRGALPEIARYVTLYRLWWTYSHEIPRAKKQGFAEAICVEADTAKVTQLELQARAASLFGAPPRRLAWFLGKDPRDLCKELREAEKALAPKNDMLDLSVYLTTRMPGQ